MPSREVLRVFELPRRDPEVRPTRTACQVQRVIHNLAKEWVLTEAALMELSPADLRRLDVPAITGIPQRGC